MSVSKTFEVDAMCCPGCEKNVQVAIKDINGVDNVRADRSAAEINVDFDDASVSEETIVREIERAGCGMS